MVEPAFWVECKKCRHRWIGAILPMALEKFAKLIGSLHCPNCAADASEIVSAPEKTDG